VRLDVFSILDQVIGDPDRLTDVTHPCIRIDTRAQAFCPTPDRYLFWDGIHPTVAGHGILARSAAVALDASRRTAAR